MTTEVFANALLDQPGIGDGVFDALEKLAGASENTREADERFVSEVARISAELPTDPVERRVAIRSLAGQMTETTKRGQRYGFKAYPRIQQCHWNNTGRSSGSIPLELDVSVDMPPDGLSKIPLFIPLPSPEYNLEFEVFYPRCVLYSRIKLESVVLLPYPATYLDYSVPPALVAMRVCFVVVTVATSVAWLICKHGKAILLFETSVCVIQESSQSTHGPAQP